MIVPVIYYAGDIHAPTPDLHHGLALPLSGKVSLQRGPQPHPQVAPPLGQWYSIVSTSLGSCDCTLSCADPTAVLPQGQEAILVLPVHSAA